MKLLACGLVIKANMGEIPKIIASYVNIIIPFKFSMKVSFDRLNKFPFLKVQKSCMGNWNESSSDESNRLLYAQQRLLF